MIFKNMIIKLASLNWRKAVFTAIMFFFGIITILPFLWMISTSLKTTSEVFTYPVQWLPSEYQWGNYARVWFGENSFAIYFKNSIIVSVVCTIFAILFASMAAYGFSKVEFRGRNGLFLFYLSMMMIPPEVLFVPKFVMFNWAGIYNTLWALILPGMVSILGVFLLRQFFLGIPKDISESAYMDGAGHFKIYFQLILPLAKPAIATLGILHFSMRWNDYENALIFLIDRKLYTIPLGLKTFVLENSVDYSGMMTAATSSILPMIIVFLFAQKYVIQGVSNTAIKG